MLALQLGERLPGTLGAGSAAHRGRGEGRVDLPEIADGEASDVEEHVRGLTRVDRDRVGGCLTERCERGNRQMTAPLCPAYSVPAGGQSHA